MTTGELITRWTVRLALLCYFVALILRLRSVSPHRHNSFARLIYSLGCALFIAHVVAAFHVFHHWSHHAALEETARQTRELTGINSSLGLWLNYLFTLLWLLDTITWWRGLHSHRERRRAIDLALHGFMIFIIFNATVIFETGPTRWFGAIGCASVLFLAIKRK